MVMQRVPARNEERLRRGAFGWETERGELAAFMAKLYWKLRLTNAMALEGEEEDTGGWDPYTDREQGLPVISGTLTGPLAFEDLNILLRMAVSGETAGVADAGSPPAYALTGVPSFDEDNLSSISVETEAPDDPFTSTMVMMTEFTVTADADAAGATWMLNASVIARSYAERPRTLGQATSATASTLTVTAAGWTVDQFAGATLQIVGGAGDGQEVKIASNTATVLTTTKPFATPPDQTSLFRIIPVATVVPDRNREFIRARGTRIYIDDEGGTLGATQLIARGVSFSFTVALNRSTKAFLEDDTAVSRTTGRGSRLVTWQLRIERDRERPADTRTEYQAYLAGLIRRIVIEQTGKIIHDAVRSKARIVIPRGKYLPPSDAPRNANMTMQMGGEAYLDKQLGYSFAMPAITRVASVG